MKIYRQLPLGLVISLMLYNTSYAGTSPDALLPGYVRMDIFGAYKLKLAGTKVTTQINIRNILDKDYYESTDPDSNVAPALGIAPGAPLTAIGSIRVEY
jgi:outer membrane receptor protein involved in Fe transport